jgi:hypothetical protein
MIALVTAVLLGVGPSPVRPVPAEPYVYRAVFLQAAPGRLLELVDLFKATLPVYAAAGQPRPLLGRHTQGDIWDIMLVEPVGSQASLYAPERISQWDKAATVSGLTLAEFRRRLEPLVAWREELFVNGPPLAEFERRNTEGGFYHLEIFQGLAGKRDSLYRERLMEDDYSRRIGRPDNLVFTRVGGAAWDLFTIGFYRNLQHYAEPVAVTPEQEEAAARAAGFASRNDIGAYMRRFILLHHDTLLVPIR